MKNKRQHFVSQYYLRQFRAGETNQLGVATIEPPRIIGLGSITGQCQEDNFYEDDKLDALLRESENAIAPILAGLDVALDFTAPQLSALRLLAVELHFRTRKAVESAKVFPRYVMHQVIQNAIDHGKLPPPPGGKWTEDMVDVGGMPGFLIKHGVIPCWLEMQTLHCKLLRTTNDRPFVTSDNPTVCLNQFAIGADPVRAFVGFAQAGFQLILPVSPRQCLFFYDARVYKVGGRGKRLLEISHDDVETINALQVQAANECIYFHDVIHGEDILSLMKTHLGLRTRLRDSLREIQARVANETFLHIQAPAPKLPQPWTFCRLRRRISARPGERRDRAWTATIDSLMDDIDRSPLGGDIFDRLERILGTSASFVKQ